MNNKPKYHLFNNTRYAIDGLVHAIKNESSFRLELLMAVFIIVGIIYIDVSITQKMILLVSGILVLIVELINSAIENVVDLNTLETKPLAKAAKDIGAAAVMLCILLHVTCWVLVLI